MFLISSPYLLLPVYPYLSGQNWTLRDNGIIGILLSFLPIDRTAAVKKGDFSPIFDGLRQKCDWQMLQMLNLGFIHIYSRKKIYLEKIINEMGKLTVFKVSTILYK